MTILIPIIAENDEFASLQKAIVLSDNKEAIKIHFVRFIPILPWVNLKKWMNFSKTKNISTKRNNIQIADIARNEEILKNHPNISFHSSSIHLKKNSKELIKYIKKHNIDILIICKDHWPSNFYSIFNMDIDKIVQLSSCPVLTFPHGSTNHIVRSIIIPIGETMQELNIQFAITFATKFKSLVRLVTFLEASDKDELRNKLEVFYQTYKLLKNEGYTPNYTFFERPESTKFILTYANRNNFDLVILHPKTTNQF